jgi:large subunit ribosomal protein L22
VPISATAKDTGVSVKKVKPIADLIRGKMVGDALEVLDFFPSPVAALVAKVVRSATANAENEMMFTASELKVVGIWANEGTSLKRMRARARGRYGRILRRNSHVTVVLDQEAKDLGE